MRRLVLMLVATAVMATMLALSAAPALAFIHAVIPAGSCPQPAAHEAADNETAEGALTGTGETPAQGAVDQGAKDLPLGNVTNAPTECPAP